MKLNHSLFLSLTLIFMLLIAGCNLSGQEIAKSASPPAVSPSASPVVARINGLEFTLAELERELAFDRATYKLSNGKELVLQDLSGTLQGLIPTLLLDQQARQAGIEVSQAETTTKLNEYVASRNSTLDDLEKELTKHGATLADFRQHSITRMVRIEKYLDQTLEPEQDFSAWLDEQYKQTKIEILYQPSTESPLSGGAAPDFTLTNLKGEAVVLSQFRGRPVVLNFWATWCVPCREEMPLFQNAYKTHQDKGLVILALNFEEEANIARPYVEELGLTFEILLDHQATVAWQYRVTGLPITIFIDRQGIIQHIQIGQIKEEILAGLLEKIL
jgi:cytochrome c biogenesis protein CcmG/thiol:disulfide interchange protein DsbE